MWGMMWLMKIAKKYKFSKMFINKYLLKNINEILVSEVSQ